MDINKELEYRKVKPLVYEDWATLCATCGYYIIDIPSQNKIACPRCGQIYREVSDNAKT